MRPTVFDVNVFVSAVIGPLGIPRQLWLAWQRGRFPLVSSDHIITTTMARLRLPRIADRYALTEEDVRSFEVSVRSQATIVPVATDEILLVTGDPEDDAVLATARLGQAGYLVTGDRGLLMLGTYAGARIVSPRDFLTVLSQERPPGQ